ncbi:MAG: hypothetical protein ACKPDI_08260 [Actinomycetota bacterium]
MFPPPDSQPHPGHEPQPADPQHADPLAALAGEADAVLQAIHHRMQTIEPQLRRFGRAVADLGLPVPTGWATHDDHQVTFSALTPRQFDAMIRMLEDIAANRPIVITRGQGGASLFESGSAVGPTPARVVSSMHMSVPR